MLFAISAFADEMCVVTFKIKQFLQIPVDCDFYNTLSIGQELQNEFKVGSFIFNGDFSRLNITVENKQNVKK